MWFGLHGWARLEAGEPVYSLYKGEGADEGQQPVGRRRQRGARGQRGGGGGGAAAAVAA